MKQCPQCGREYDASMMFCLDDGAELLYGPASVDERATAILSEPGAEATHAQIHTTDRTAIFPRGGEAEPHGKFNESSERQILSANRAAKPPEGESPHRAAEPQERRAAVPGSKRNKLLGATALIGILLAGGFFGYRYFASTTKQIESIAVMPFVNEGGNSDVEFLSDGMTETLISSLTKVPNLNVKSRSSMKCRLSARL